MVHKERQKVARVANDRAGLREKVIGSFHVEALPMELDVCIPDNDPMRLISQFVEEMGLATLYSTYERLPSEKYASPEIMLKIILYAYHEGKEVSSRTIEKNCRRDINYMYLLEGRRIPGHAAIARFRTNHFAKCAQQLMAQMTELLHALGQVTATEVFIDGTKIKASANKYTFVWKKAVTKYQARSLQKTALLVGDIIERYEFKPLWNKEIHKRHVKKLLKKLKEYETKLHTCGGRNSYSKTDRDATFMHMKDDHMKNRHLKPGYNLQQIEADLAFRFARLVADAEYESEENLKYLEGKGMDAFVKPANYEQIGTKKFKKQIGRKENMQYDTEKDCYICHNGKEIKRRRTKRTKTASGYVREETHYRCSECDGCLGFVLQKLQKTIPLEMDAVLPISIHVNGAAALTVIFR